MNSREMHQQCDYFSDTDFWFQVDIVMLLYHDFKRFLAKSGADHYRNIVKGDEKDIVKKELYYRKKTQINF